VKFTPSSIRWREAIVSSVYREMLRHLARNQASDRRPHTLGQENRSRLSQIKRVARGFQPSREE